VINRPELILIIVFNKRLNARQLEVEVAPTIPPKFGAVFLLTALVVSACSAPPVDPPEVPTSYAFDSRIGTGSSVSYSGQVHRHVLIGEMKAWLGGLTAKIDGGKVFKAGDVRKQLLFFYDYKAGDGAEIPIALKTDLPLLQIKLGMVGSANLKAKVAGNDEKGQHKKWATDFTGWQGANSPEGLLLGWFDALDDATIDRIAGQVVSDPNGKAITKVFVTAEGHDLQQLVQKFLLGAVAFSQGADDYLDDDIAGKGLQSQNSKPDKEGAAYTSLEHQWDEGFGYFGAARDFGDYTDDEIAAKGGRDGYKAGYHDSDGDGKIDLKSEMNWGHALNCAKRDRGSRDIAPTNYTADAFDAFLKGRTIIAAAAGRELSDVERVKLLEQRDVIVQTWEKAIAATVLHYINEVLGDLASVGGAKYDFYSHAKHWSELKGFALSLQFSRFSPPKLAFLQLHAAIGDAPAPATVGDKLIGERKAALVAAKKMLATAYAFDTKLLADDAGVGGW
jgi:hypothetical protein